MSKSLPQRILAFSTLAALFAAPNAMAERAESGREYVFTTVDSYTVRMEGYVDITGVLQGEAAPRTLTFTVPNGDLPRPAVYSDRCDRLALLAMAKPGAYLFTMSSGSSVYYSNFVCQLARVP